MLDLSDGLPWARWCIGGILNIAESCLRHPPDQIAVIWEGEEGATRTLTYGELSRHVDVAAAGFRTLGVKKGDAVAIHLPMLPETVVALLATAQIGAVAVPLFSGYGPSALASRIQDVGAKIVITCDAFPRRGKPVPAKSVLDHAIQTCPSVHHVIVVNRMGDASGLTWDSLSGTDASTELTEAEDRLIVLYTSGTTGRPKGILHSHCGFPIKSAQDMYFRDRRRTRHAHLLDHRYRLDDGSVAAVRSADSRRYRCALRWRAGLSRPRPDVGILRPAIGWRYSGSHRHWSARSLSMVPSPVRGTTWLRFVFLPPPASHGTPTRGGGCLKRWARGASPS